MSLPSLHPTRLARALVALGLGCAVPLTALAAASGAPGSPGSPGSAGSPGAARASGPPQRAVTGAAYSWRVRLAGARRVGARTLGTAFTVRRSGRAVGLRIYDASTSTDRFRLTLFGARGARLASGVTSAGGARHRWRTVRLSREVRLVRGHRYVVAASAAPGEQIRVRTRPRQRGSLVPLRALAGSGTRAAPTRRIPGGVPVAVSYRPRIGPFPTAATTGGPAPSRLTAYRGPCTITRDRTVIAHRLVTCDLAIRASHVVVRRSVVHGTISSAGRLASFSVVHSTVDASPGDVRLVTGVGDAHFRVIASEIRGGNRGIDCARDCTVRRSWVHGQDRDAGGRTHESGVRMGEGSRIVGNTLVCDAPDVPPDAGCSASLTGYGDFAPVRDNLISGNYFPPSTGGTCAYGGSSGGKPFSAAAARVRFFDNVFARGRSGQCGVWAPVMDFDRRAPGNDWAGNAWVSGAPVRP